MCGGLVEIPPHVERRQLGHKGVAGAGERLVGEFRVDHEQRVLVVREDVTVLPVAAAQEADPVGLVLAGVAPQPVPARARRPSELLTVRHAPSPR